MDSSDIALLCKETGTVIGAESQLAGFVMLPRLERTSEKEEDAAADEELLLEGCDADATALCCNCCTDGGA